jgi:hypothetical protein
MLIIYVLNFVKNYQLGELEFVQKRQNSHVYFNLINQSSFLMNASKQVRTSLLAILRKNKVLEALCALLIGEIEEK